MSCPLQKAPRPDRTEPAEALHLCALGRLGAPDWRPHPGSACSWLLKGPWMPSRLPGSQGPSSVQSKVPRGNWPLCHLGGELSPWSDGLGSSRPLAHWERWCWLLGTAGCGEGRGRLGGQWRPAARTLTEPRQQAQQCVLIPLLGDVQHVVQPHLAGHALLLQEPAPQRRQPPSGPRARALPRHARSRTW